MKSRYITYIAIMAGLQLFSSSCSDDFLEVEPKGRNLEENYYRNETEAYNGLIAAYDPVGWVGNNLVTKVGAVNSASDDHFAGGGGANDITAFQVWDDYTLDPATGPQDELWKKGYSGVFRSNVLISKLSQVPMDESRRARFMAEAKFLRAYYYFDLIRLFERIPLITEPVPTSEIYTIQQVDRTAVYEQIEADLIEAIPDLPAMVATETEAGRATQGAARALLGKVYLQQEEFGPAAEQLSQVNGIPGGISQYGYKLLNNFGDLWVTSNKFNTESIFEVSHTSTSNGVWDCIGCTEGNLLNIMLGPRGYSIKKANAGAPEYLSGWSFNTVTPSLVNAFISPDGDYDPRYKYTISNIDSLAKAGVVEYSPGYKNTGYFVAKFAGKKADQSTGGGNYELNFKQNMYEIRLADTYLMEAEALVRSGGDAARAQALLDAVRARVGLSPVTVTFENILHERRVELAAEGHRWFDLVRTGRAASKLADRGYVEGKHDALPIPILEFNNTALEQDPAYQ